MERWVVHEGERIERAIGTSSSQIAETAERATDVSSWVDVEEGDSKDELHSCAQADVVARALDAGGCEQQEQKRRCEQQDVHLDAHSH